MGKLSRRHSATKEPRCEKGEASMCGGPCKGRIQRSHLPGGRVQLSDPFGKPGGQMCFRIRLPKRRAACSLLVRRRPVGSREPHAFRSTRAEQSRTFRWTEKDQITSRQFKSVFGANSSASEVTKETPFRNGGDRFAMSRGVSCHVVALSLAGSRRSISATYALQTAELWPHSSLTPSHQT